MIKKILVFLFLTAGLICLGQTDSISNHKRIKFMAVGDIMLGTDFPNASYLPPKDEYPFMGVQSVFDRADVLFGNLEGCLSDTGKNAKTCKDPSKCYSFRSPQRFGVFFKQAGFDLVSVANNHIGDFGPTGIKNTLATLDENGIAAAGLLSQPTTVFKKDGITYGFVAFAPNRDCVKLTDVPKAIRYVRELNEKVDIVIVSFHGGAEGTQHRHITRKTEYFYGENRGNVYEFAHKMIDAGADIIIGHGPHVPRAIEVYKSKLIMYSLGNFATYRRFSLGGVKGFAPIVEADLDQYGNFIRGNIHSAIQKDGVYPKIDPEQGAFKDIQALTNADFPESSIIFQPDGSFTTSLN